MRGRKLKAVCCVLCCAVLLFASLPAAASRDIEENAHEKLIAFWHQEAYDGLNNGEAVFDHEWMQGVFYEGGGDPSTLHYEGSYYTPLISSYGENIILSFDWYVWYCFEEEMPDGNILSGEGYDYVYPDLYGPLELSETAMWEIKSPRADQTHITSINLDSCPKLKAVRFNGQRHVTSFSALGSDGIETLELTNDSLRSIAFSPEAFDEPIELFVFGAGSIGAGYNKNSTPDKATIRAYVDGGQFHGWYKDGTLYKHQTVCNITEGGRYVVCFGGDINGDGRIEISDALQILRAAMGLSELYDFTEADIDCSGAVEAADALSLLRLVLGVY